MFRPEDYYPEDYIGMTDGEIIDHENSVTLVEDDETGEYRAA